MTRLERLNSRGRVRVARLDERLRGVVIRVIPGLTVLTTAGVLFASRLFTAAGVDRFAYRLGIATPTGHRLRVSSRHFWPLSESYVGTSRATVWVDREVETQTLVSEDGRVALSRGVLEELLYYFGMTLEEPGFAAQLKHIRERGGVPI